VSPAPLVPGLYGKLPAHGDFVRRGWSDVAVARLDEWLADGLVRLRGRAGEEGVAAALQTAPAWIGVVPGGMAGEEALLVALAPSADRVGRLFFLTLGLAGPDGAIAAQGALTPLRATLDALLYDAVAGRLDADAVVARLADLPFASDPVPVGWGQAGWWPLDALPGAAPLVADALTADLFDRLVAGPA